ncbi:MAG: glutamine--tRNA ligase/YqeY domain fusion protein [Myxococcales bacterium]|nr:MAG: glutamine--tRNA ligase/YqeY domain fusion protein [Myxococcales bacterium]
MTSETGPARDFIRDIVAADVAAGKNGGAVVTRFPPEPNGYLHIGHAKSICLNFGVAAENARGRCHLRFDDTNPTAEDTEYVDSIREDVRWLGFDWNEHLYYASDYFERLHGFAIDLIRACKAYVCDLDADGIREHRGTLKEPGRDSPYRERSVEENLDLFARMSDGEFDAGTRTLRAKIDMSSPIIVMRDPVIYRIQRAHHHRTGDRWSVYPMYDFAHCLSDSIEGITHSLCTLEFADNKALYDWILDQLDVSCHPEQIEFGRLDLTYTVMSKRILRRLVEEGHVEGWNDPRMPTLAAMRRRGYPAPAIRRFCTDVGVTRHHARVQFDQLEHAVRDELNRTAPRVMAVLRPLKVVIENYPEGGGEELEAVNNPEDPSAGTRRVPFSRELYIERDDFLEDPPKKFFRLAPGREVRLRYAYFVRCEQAIKDADGNVVELRCSYDPATRGGDAPDGRKVKATLHWVSAAHAISAEVRLYDRLFTRESPLDLDEGEDFTVGLNGASLEILRDCPVEPALACAVAGDRYQFERLGYFCVDRGSTPGRVLFNRTVTLRDAWAKVAVGRG